jgi:dTDP-4-amino-4,6-dideoxygalactose transaminase
MTKESALSEYQRRFAEWFGGGTAFGFWKGRVALYAILKAAGVGQGDEVVLPGYTCVMNVNPIKYLGAKPVYVDIEPKTFNINPELLAKHITGRTKAIIAQHTYGYTCDMDALMDIAGRKGLMVIEDCCLCLGSRYKGKLAGTFGRAAYFSFQWNKPYTTGLGGMALVNDKALSGKVDELVSSDAHQPGFAEVLMLWAELCAYRTLVYPRTTALAQNIFRYLTSRGAVVGSSAQREFQPVMPADFFKRMGWMQARSGLGRLKMLDANIAHREKMVRLYDKLLGEKGWRVGEFDKGVMQPVMVRYPVRVTEKSRALAEASKAGVELGSWFECPLHPKETPMEIYDYKTGMCPEAERASSQVVNLPLHPRTNERTIRRTVEFITRFQRAV